MPTYETTVEIAAPVERVYAVTVDLERWPAWNPTVETLSVREGFQVSAGTYAVLKQPKLRRATWRVAELRPPSLFVWGTSGAGYAIEAGHYLTPAGDGTSVRLTLDLTGPLAPLLWPLVRKRSVSYVDQEAAALKKHCET